MEYRSTASFLGLPLVHVAIGSWMNGRYRRGVATAWFAVGDLAIGVFLACGGVALGGISLGGAAFGVLPMGGMALGVLAVGGLGLGVIALGGAAFAWYLAVGGLAVAYQYGIGGVALAQTVLAPSAWESLLFTAILSALLHWSNVVGLMVMLGVLLVTSRVVQGRRRQR